MGNDKTENSKPASWSASTEDASINQDDIPSGEGGVHVNVPGGSGYTLCVNGFDGDGYPRTSKWYDDD